MVNLHWLFTGHNFYIYGMKKIAVFAGSFDPFTLGHLDIVKRAAALFDELYVLLAVNASKKYMFSESARIEMIRKADAGVPNVKVESFDGLTVEFMKRIGAKFLVRGIRGSADVEYEQSVAWNNKVLYPECETVFLSSAPEHLMVSSTVVRELVAAGKMRDVRGLLGRPYQIRGSVRHGRGRGGGQLGFPTANLRITEEDLCPKRGVYVTQVIYDGTTYGGVSNIGFNPTFGEETLVAETHIFGFKDAIYGKPLRINLVRHLREERKFPGLEALVAQIRKDIEVAKRVLAREEAAGT